MYLTLTIALCLVPLALSEESRCKDVPGVKNFDYKSIFNQLYKVVCYSGIEAMKDLTAGIRTTFQSNNKSYSVLVYDTNDGKQYTFTYLIEKAVGSTIYETRMDNDKLTDGKIKTVIVGYKENEYMEIYYCGTDIPADMRLVLIPSENDLEEATLKEIQANDATLGFQSPLVSIS